MNNYLAYNGTFSKSPDFYGFPPDLTIVETSGAKVKLSDGSHLIDFVNGLGSNLIGYRNPQFYNAVEHQLYQTGGSLSLPHRLEYEVAEKLCILLSEHIPGWRPDNISVRFGKTGSDATNMAIRLARAATGREWIVVFRGHYHGWGEWTISRTPPAHGLVGDQKVVEIEWGSTSALQESLDSEVAAVIFEIGLNDPDPQYLADLHRICDEYGILVIVDEVVTGLRYRLGGACERYGIKPDLVCMGKALGNGLPISALVGKREYMDWFKRDDPVFCSSTMWGESVGLAAADYVLSVWDQEKVDQIWHYGAELIRGLREVGWQVIGHPPRSLLMFQDDYERAFFIRGMKEQGVLMNRPNFITLAHTSDHLQQTVDAAEMLRQRLDRMSQGELIEAMGPYLPRVLFRNR